MTSHKRAQLPSMTLLAIVMGFCEAACHKAARTAQHVPAAPIPSSTPTASPPSLTHDTSAPDEMFEIRDAQVRSAAGNFVAQAGHTSSVTAAAFLRETRFLLTSSSDQSVRLWDVESGKIVRTFATHEGRVNAFAVAQDQKHILAGGTKVTLWNIEDGKHLASFPAGGDVLAIAFEGAGRATWQTRLLSQRPAKGDGGPLWKSRWASHEANLADGSVRSNPPIESGESEVRSTFQQILSPDGKLAILSGFENDTAIWNVARAERLRPIDASFGMFFHGDGPQTAIAPNGRIVVTAHDDSVFKAWNVDSGDVSSTFADQKNLAHECATDGGMRVTGTIAIASDNRTVASGDGRSFALWDATTGNLVRRLQGCGGARRIVFSPNGNRIIMTDAHGQRLLMWNALTGRVVSRANGPIGTCDTITFSGDGKRVAIGCYDGTIYVLNGLTGAVKKVLPKAAPVEALVVSARGHLVVANGNAVDTWDLAKVTRIRSARFKEPIGALAVSRDGNTLAAASYDGTLQVSRLDTGATLHKTIIENDFGGIHSLALAISPDATRIALAAGTIGSVMGDEVVGEGKLHVFDATKGTQIRSMDTSTMHPFPWANGVLFFSPDGSTIVGGANVRNLASWNASTGEVRESPLLEATPSCSDGTQLASAAALSRDGLAMIVGLSGCHVELRDRPHNRRIAILPRSASATAAAISPDGEWIALGHASGEVTLWEIKTKRQRWTFEGHSDDVRSVAFLPNGRAIASGSEDGTVRLWSVDGSYSIALRSNGDQWIAYDDSGAHHGSKNAEALVAPLIAKALVNKIDK